ncbi:hypothetical protein ADIMK_1580 [Marinobacterium lacunae]|uniref:Uncharacterized protein n=1 Tax=Marinobacterium lacunae TaxID=1232683 RepID=A0A081G0M9_9GAMM|nr:hypothetical protein ADIMK_1580 [Marinobacterium lacunae]
MSNQKGGEQYTHRNRFEKVHAWVLKQQGFAVRQYYSDLGV